MFLSRSLLHIIFIETAIECHNNTPYPAWNSYILMLYNFQHWIRLDMQPDVLVHSLKMTVDPSDSSYMPSLLVVSGGDSFTAMNELATVNIRNTDTMVSLLSDVKEVRLPVLFHNIPLHL